MKDALNNLPARRVTSRESTVPTELVARHLYRALWTSARKSWARNGGKYNVPLPKSCLKKYKGSPDWSGFRVDSALEANRSKYVAQYDSGAGFTQIRSRVLRSARREKYSSFIRVDYIAAKFTQNRSDTKVSDRGRSPKIHKRDLRSAIYLSPGTAVTDLWSGLVIHVTCGVGLPCAEQPNWDPVVLEKTRVLGGSRTKTGPCWPSANFTLHPKNGRKGNTFVNIASLATFSPTSRRLSVVSGGGQAQSNLAHLANLYCLSFAWSLTSPLMRNYAATTLHPSDSYLKFYVRTAF